MSSAWLESSLFKSLELEKNTHTHTQAGGKVIASQTRGHSYSANPRENSQRAPERGTEMCRDADIAAVTSH